MASVFPVKKGSSKYCVMYWYETETGEKKQKKVSGFNSKEEAWAAAQELEAKSSIGIEVNVKSITCAEIMERWFSDRCMFLAPTTRAKYSSSIDKLGKTFVADLQIRKLDSKKFYLLLDELQNNISKEKITIRTALSNTEPLRMSLTWAVREKLIPLNPLANVQLPKIPKRTQKILNETDIDDLVTTADSAVRRCRNFKIPLLLALYGGLRREECAGLRWDHVDFEHNRITISEAVVMTPDGKHHEKDPKTDLSSRTISMPAWVMDELLEVYKRFLERPNAFIMKHNPAHRVCVTSTGEPYSCASYAHALLRLIREINKKREAENKPRMPEASFHDLRHTHAAMLIRRNVQPKVISERLGHASIKITMDLYGYLMPGLQDIVAEIFDKEAEQSTIKITTAG